MVCKFKNKFQCAMALRASVRLSMAFLMLGGKSMGFTGKCLKMPFSLVLGLVYK